MRRRVALLVLGVGALLLTPGAVGIPDVPGDPTPPVVTPVITGTLGDAGWYRSNVTLNWTVVDPESIILSTTGCDARTLTADTSGTQIICSAASDGGETTITKTFKLDKTAPAASATPSRPADANGWYNHELTVSFAGNDGTSGLESCSAAQTYSGPDTTGTSVSGTCRDRAGNAAPAALPLKYDETAPQASPAARAPDANGWYNHAVTVGFQGADGTSGVANCTQVTYGGPDDPSVALSGTCLDRAGNQSPSSGFTLKYDETAPQASATPSRTADVNGWHNHSLTVSFAGSDATSGLESCDPPKTYAGPDAVNASVTGSCSDRAGNVAPRSFGLKYDATAPQTTVTPSRQPNANGWYNAALTVTYSGTDTTSGIDSCAAPKSYSGPDDSAAPLGGSCTDQAGNVGAAPFPVKYDATNPQTTAAPGRGADANGWYNRAVAVTFAGTDATSGIDSCDAAKSYSGPDAAAATVTGACRDRAGNSTAGSFGLKYDATQPQATATPARQPNANGWYNTPLGVTFAGSDATSGLASCDPAKSYAGPDGSTAAVTGTCLDRAGNSGSASLTLKYDATAPQATATPSRQPNANGWFNAPVSVGFGGSDSTAGIDSCDASMSYSGPDVASTTLTGACRDVAGNIGSTSFVLKYDATAPQTTVTPARQPNGNGWYNAALSVGFAGTDATSTVDSCDPAKSYSGPDTGSASVAGACRDKAGNSGSASFALKYDTTAPETGATPSRPSDRNGWYNHALTVAFAATDATSTVASCDPVKSYAGPDSASTAVSGTCFDKAGNAGGTSFALKYDATPPQTSATPSRQANANGWYNAPLTVSFAATDAASQFDSCAQPQSYAGPDSATAVVSGTCMDKAGNSALASLAVRYDTTPPQATATPSRQPNANGWYRQQLTITFVGADLTSGIASCSGARDYAGPDAVGAALAGSCRDRADNQSAETTFGFKYDGTPPQVNGAVAVRSPDHGGWYNRPVAFAVQGADTTSGVDSCPALTYSGPDSAAASVTAACLDRAGNEGTKSFPLKYDATGPDVTAGAGRDPDAGGWYNHPVTVSFSGSDSASGLDSCTGPEGYDGPDSSLAVVSGFCLDGAGNVGLASLQVHYDATAPEVTGATPRRPPDANGWYNHPLVVGFEGSDATSELEACTQTSYAGPDSAGVSVTGSCRDRAGNGSRDASFTLKYDATAPRLNEVRAKAGNRTAGLSWVTSPDTVVVEVLRAGATVYKGSGRAFTDTRLKNGVRYRYTVTAYDEAHNAAAKAVTVTPTAPLIAPAAGAAVKAPVRLAWAAVEKATHYNVQVWRQGKILSAWPKRTSMEVRRSWTYGGRRYRLAPGRYRWFVWPGYGSPASRKYGPLLGSSSFVVKAPRR